MKLQTLSVLLVLALGLVFIGAAWPSTEPLVLPVVHEHSELTLGDESQVLESANLRSTSALAEYTRARMEEWPRALIPAVDYGDVAWDIADAAMLDPSWGDAHWTVGRKAILLASLGYFEGARYARYVDEKNCNDPTWRASVEGRKLLRFGSCDNGIAVSLWQIHPSTFQDMDGKFVSFTKEHLSNRLNAARAALVIARRSLVSTGTLRWYSGEWTGPFPKAEERLRFAEKAYAEHPFTL